MPGDKSDFLSSALLQHVFDISSYTAPTNIYIAAFVNGVEVSGDGYERVEVANGSTEWSESGQEVTNDNEIAFPEATGSWGTPDGIGLFDASNGGNELYFDPEGVDEPKEITAGDTLKIAAGQLKIQES